MKIIICKWKTDVFCVFFMLFAHSAHSTVRLTVDSSEDVEMGKPFKLLCETQEAPSGSRRWVGGKKTDTLCFNGVSQYPSEYKEDQIIENKKYSLTIVNLTESDLNCPYSCRFGFEKDERVIFVNETNFRYVPKNESVRVEYTETNGEYSLSLTFDKVFPEPRCSLKLTKQNLTVVNKKQSDIFYSVSFNDRSNKSFHSCGNAIEIQCTIKNFTYNISHNHQMECSHKHTDPTDKNHTGKIVGLAVVVSLIVILVAVVVTRMSLRIKQRRKAKRDNLRGSQECHEPLNQDTKLASLTVPVSVNDCLNERKDKHLLYPDLTSQSLLTLPMPVPSPDEKRGGIGTYNTYFKQG